MLFNSYVFILAFFPGVMLGWFLLHRLRLHKAALMFLLLMSLLFFGLYVSMPNTHVEWRCAIVPGIVAGVGIQWLQLFYVHSQIWVTGYNAIYGSFAALPLFMLWVQISWTICLFGAELTYTNQNLNRLGINIESVNAHPYVEMGDDERDDTSVAMYANGIDGL